MTAWTDEERDTVKRGWTEGRSAGELAKEMHKTRSAVMGQVHRQGLARHPTGVRNTKEATCAAKEHRVASAKRTSVYTYAPKGQKPAYNPPLMKLVDRKTLWSPPASGKRVELADLAWHHCRWPYTDQPTTSYCGAQRVGNLPYCVKHASIAFPPKIPK